MKSPFPGSTDFKQLISERFKEDMNHIAYRLLSRWYLQWREWPFDSLSFHLNVLCLTVMLKIKSQK